MMPDSIGPQTPETNPSRASQRNNETLALIKEFFHFLRERKKYWLLPIVFIMILLGGLILLTSNPIIAPFIYTIF
ncbi:MAG: hypothetical protein HPY51_14065 [Candidatus Omnitrophica bacterium]|nr:hypothetical protein [Candidatus Omnitrophota bacterium]